MKRVLVAGIGNIFMGDDGFGCAVAQRLARQTLPPGVQATDFGIRGMDLAYALADCDEAILVDCAPRGTAPGTLQLIEPQRLDQSAAEGLPSPHGLTPHRVLRLLPALRERPLPLRLLSCEPESLGGAQGHIGLSAVVEEAVGRAVAQLLSLLAVTASSAAADEAAKPLLQGE